MFLNYEKGKLKGIVRSIPKKAWAEEMVQWLGHSPFFEMNLCLVPRTNIRQLAAIQNSSSRESNTPCCPWAPAHFWGMQIHTGTYMYTKSEVNHFLKEVKFGHEGKNEMYFSKHNNDSHLKISLNIEYFYINTKYRFIFEKCVCFSSLLLWNLLYLFTLGHSLHTSVKEMKIFLIPWNVCILPW